MRPPDCLSVAAGLPTKLELEAAPQFKSYSWDPEMRDTQQDPAVQRILDCELVQCFLLNTVCTLATLAFHGEFRVVDWKLTLRQTCWVLSLGGSNLSGLLFHCS